jgi:CDP-diglyceride synthetase
VPAAQRAAGQADDVQEGAEGAAGPQPGDPRAVAGAGPAGQHYDEELPWPRPDDPWESDPELPHWTDAPTGEVPAVLRHDQDAPTGTDDPWSSMPPPSWREENLDWESQEGSFSPSMLAEQEPPGMLDDTNALEQPWRFDIPASSGPGAAGGQTYVPGRPGSEAQDPRDAGDLGTPMHPMDLDEPTDTLPAVGRGPQGGRGPSEPDEEFYVDRRTGAPYEESPYAGETYAAASAQGHPYGADPYSEHPYAGDAYGAPGAERSPGGDAIYDYEVAPQGGQPVASASAGVVDADEIMAGGAAAAPSGRGSGERRRIGRRPQGGAGTAVEAPPVAAAAAAPPPRAEAGRREGSAGPVRTQPHPPGPPREVHVDRNLPVAIATGVAIGAITLIAFKLGNVASLLWITVVAVVAAAEGYAALRRANYRPATLLGLVAVVGIMIGTYNKGTQAIPLAIILLVAFTLVWYLAGVEHAEPVRGTASTLLIFCWVGVFSSYAALLLNPSLFPDRHGIAFLLGAIITAVAYDVGALAVGSWIGRRPLAPSISPNKTWEGLFGGAAASILAAIIVVHAISPWTVGKALALGIVVAVVAPLGDLCESLIKRGLDVKDMGRLLPGHGGLLDRLDSLIFVIPATYYLVKAVHLG